MKRLIQSNTDNFFGFNSSVKTLQFDVNCESKFTLMKLIFSLVILSFTYSLSAQKENCFEFIYPLTFELTDGSVLEVDNHRAMMNGASTEAKWDEKLEKSFAAQN